MVLLMILSQSSKVALVNMEKIYNEYIDLKDAREQVIRYKATLEVKRDSVKRKLDSLQSALEKQWPILTDAERILRQREIEGYKRQLDSISNFIIKQVEAKSKEVMTPYIQKVRETTERIAKGMGYEVVLDVSNAVWYDSRHDITPLVLDELNKAYRGVEFLQKKVIVFPFREEDDQAASYGLGDTLMDYIYDVFNESTRFRVYDKNAAKMYINSKGLTKRTINERDVLSIAQTVGSDIFVFGSVSSKNNIVSFTITIYDVKTGKPVEVNGNPLSQRVENLQVGSNLSNAIRTVATDLRNKYVQSLGGG
ncbi:MAG: OmpH family outer membrane protein [candidate division WOR-3 bacterium]